MIRPFIFAFLATTTLAHATSAHAIPQAVTFESECDVGTTSTIGAVGDFLMHDPLQKKAAKRGSFIPIWQQFVTRFKNTDIMYGNLETPTARGLGIDMRQYPDPGLVYDRKVHTSYPLFNVAAQLVDDIKASGFDIVSTANNHALDRGGLGVELSIKELERAGLTYVGTRMKNSNKDDDFYRIVVTPQGIRTAWIACTVLHGNADRDRQVLSCPRDREYILELVRYLSQQTDAVIVTPHWGDEFTPRPNNYQREFGRELLEAGALAVLGAHPHVLQPMESYRTTDGRETFIIYSLANFVSFQEEVERKSTLALFFNLVKSAQGTRIQGVTFIPAYMLNRTGDFNDVEIKPIVQNDEYGHQGLEHILTLFPRENMAFHHDEINFRRFCQR